MTQVIYNGETMTVSKALKSAGIMSSIYDYCEIDHADPQEAFDAAIEKAAEMRAAGISPKNGHILVKMLNPKTEKVEEMELTDACRLHHVKIDSVQSEKYGKRAECNLTWEELIKKHADLAKSNVVFPPNDQPFELEDMTTKDLGNLFSINHDALRMKMSKWGYSKRQAISYYLTNVKMGMKRPETETQRLMMDMLSTLTIRQVVEAACKGHDGEGETLEDIQARIDLSDRPNKSKVKSDINGLKYSLDKLDKALLSLRKDEEKAKKAYEDALKKFDASTKEVSELEELLGQSREICEQFKDQDKRWKNLKRVFQKCLDTMADI